MLDVDRALKFLLGGAGLVVIIAGLKAAQDLLVPFLLALFLAVILWPLLTWLKSKRVPTWAALLLIVTGICVLGLLTGALLGASINDFSLSLPLYREKIQTQIAGFTTLLARFGLNIPEHRILQYVDPGAAINLAGLLLTSLGALLSNTFLILLTVVFILLEAASFPAKLRTAFRSGDEVLNYLELMIGKINRYMVIKTWISLATGGVLALWLAILGVDYPLLWGLLAFLFNYVPNIGSFIAAVPPLLLALIQQGSTLALLVGAGFVAVNMVLGNVLEPRLMGQRLGLSTLVVFLSLVFWGWVLGPVGMLLSVPLTMAVVIGLTNSPQTAWLGVLLSSPPPAPASGKDSTS